jgi:Replication-relaxation
VLRFLLWRLLAVPAVLVGCALLAWLLQGGVGRALRGGSRGHAPSFIHVLLVAFAGGARELWRWTGALDLRLLAMVSVAVLGGVLLLLLVRWRSRRRRRYVRLRVAVFRTDQTSAEAVVSAYAALHKCLLERWWRRVCFGQPAVALEVHYEHTPSGGCGGGIGASAAWMAVSCPRERVAMVESALRVAYANCALSALKSGATPAGSVLRLKKSAEFIRRVKALDHFEHEREPPVNRLLTTMAASGASVCVQLALTPTPGFFERAARHRFKAREARLSRERREHAVVRDRSLVEDAELRGGLDVQHRPLFFADLRIVARRRETCERVATALRADSAENRLVERGTSIRQGVFGLYRLRVSRGEGNPLPPFFRGVFATTELASIWHLPSVDYATVPFARDALPLAPAPPSVYRPDDGEGTLRDAIGPVSIHPELRKQNTAVPGAVEQGKSSYLIATVAEDLRRERCAVIVLDPKGDAADAAVSLVPVARSCTLLDFARPTCGFNPLAVDAPADVIADYVVAALKNLFTDADIRASSDRYLRNAIIAVLGYDRRATLWDAARLLSVGEEGYAYRSAVGRRIRALPAFKEISDFFAAELTAQLADARSMTTSKLDAPVNKLARLLNSASIKRVLLNDSLTVDFDRLIRDREVLIVKGALGAMGAGNTSVLMQLLVGMLDAALARQQDLVPAEHRVSVALKVDEAPLVLNRGFAETMALKRSAGLETVACWQSDAQWIDRDVREQLDALFAHRVYFATASTRDARSAVGLTMAEFSDTVRPRVEHLGVLGRPDARLHLPRHHAIASWSTALGRQAAFIGETIPLSVDDRQLALHAERQAQRGGRHLSDLRQPHWQRDDRQARPERDDASEPVRTRRSVELDGDRAGAGRAPDRSRAPSAQRPKREASPRRLTPLPDAVTESYGELVELDLAHSVRWAAPPSTARTLDPDGLDLEMLELIWRFRHVLSSQLHRRFNAERAVTTTQRRLKRLSDAGLVERFQFHRRDGGGVPMCYVLTAAGCQLLRTAGRIEREAESASFRTPRTSGRSGSEGLHWLRGARHDVHVCASALAIADALRAGEPSLRGSHEAVLSPPTRAAAGGRTAIGPADLCLGEGRVPHDFLCGDRAGGEQEVDRFASVRPDAVVELAALKPARDLIIELDDRATSERGAAKLIRYDHFLVGWSEHTRRYGQRREATPVVVFVCRSRARARACAEAADRLMRACRAYAGDYPIDWQYVGRERTVFIAERDLHEGFLLGYGPSRVPPQVRVANAHGDPRAAQAEVELRELAT